jgi:hypothetical protein
MAGEATARPPSLVMAIEETLQPLRDEWTLEGGVDAPLWTLKASSSV